MPKLIPREAFARLVIECSRPNADVETAFTMAFKAIMSGALRYATRAELLVTLAILGLTLGTGRVARVLTLKELVEGVRDDHDVPFSGINISRSKLVETLDTLEKKGLLIRLKPVNEGSNSTLSSLFAIDCKAISPRLFDRIQMFLAVADHEKQGSLVPRTGLAYIYLYKYNSVGIDGVIPNSVSRISGVASRSPGNMVRKRVMPYIGKKPPPAPSAGPTAPTAASAVLSSVQQRHTAKREKAFDAATSSDPARWNKQQMQAVLDTLTAKACPNHRLVVTERELGVLRKRLAAYRIPDFQKFVLHTLFNWTTVATQSAKAARKTLGQEAQVTRPVDPAPSFYALVYRMPYFVRVYENAKTSASAAGATAQAEDKTSALLAQRVAQLERTNAELRKIATNGARPTAPTMAPRRPVASRPADKSDDDIPEWT